MPWTDNSLNKKEIWLIERSFGRFLYVFIKLILIPRKKSITDWPAVRDRYYVQDFIARNIDYAKPPFNPVYREQPFTKGI